MPEIGFEAQQLVNIDQTIPNLVNTNNPERLEIIPTVLIPILVNAIKELNNKIIRLEEAINLDKTKPFYNKLYISTIANKINKKNWKIVQNQSIEQFWPVFS